MVSGFMAFLFFGEIWEGKGRTFFVKIQREGKTAQKQCVTDPCVASRAITDNNVNDIGQGTRNRSGQTGTKTAPSGSHATRHEGSLQAGRRKAVQGLYQPFLQAFSTQI